MLIVRTAFSHGRSAPAELVVLGVGPAATIEWVQRCVEAAHPGSCWTGQFPPAEIAGLVERWRGMGQLDAANVLRRLHRARPTWWLVAAADA
jgi:hypothetical protein